jgi:hypothetical protein
MPPHFRFGPSCISRRRKLAPLKGEGREWRAGALFWRRLMLFLLTGASGSGKSATLPSLRAALPTMDWRDFDAFGVPSPCPRQWRPQTTERWIKVALENQRQSKNTGIAGGAIMGEILHARRCRTSTDPRRSPRLPRRSASGSPREARDTRSNARNALVGRLAASACRRPSVAPGCNLMRTVG